MFKSAGQHKVTIIEAFIADPRFNKDDPEAVDVALKVRGENGEEDTWSGEISKKFGVGNAAGKMQWELTVSSLERIGWKHGIDINDDTLAELVGMETEVGVIQAMKGKDPVLTKNGEPCFNVRYLGPAPANFGPTRMDKADAKARLAAIFADVKKGGDAPAAPAAPASKPAATPNFFD